MMPALFFLLIAALCAWEAVDAGGVALLLLWPAFSFGVIGAGYLGVGPRVFGKRKDGSVAVVNTVALLPYLIPYRALWWLLHPHGTKRPSFVELVPGLFFGRRLRAAEFPAGVRCVVDLTGELASEHARAAPSIAEYISFPILDASVPSSTQAFVDLVARINAVDGAVYIHCAEGRGRAATVTAGVAIARGLADDVDAAVALLREKRLVQLSQPQRALLARALPELRALRR